ncbi:MAG: WD40 repeat domain-containing protein [Candidatus Berkelbacteria bacterium]|nr:WD40 repeat domain-containing protein [Candidatus Berkelbacteria bacterium]
MVQLHFNNLKAAEKAGHFGKGLEVSREINHLLEPKMERIRWRSYEKLTEFRVEIPEDQLDFYRNGSWPVRLTPDGKKLLIVNASKSFQIYDFETAQSRTTSIFTDRDETQNNLGPCRLSVQNELFYLTATDFDNGKRVVIYYDLYDPKFSGITRGGQLPHEFDTLDDEHTVGIYGNKIAKIGSGFMSSGEFRLPDQSVHIEKIKLSRDGRLVYALSKLFRLYVWDYKSEKFIQEPNFKIAQFVTLPNDRIACIGWDHKIYLLENLRDSKSESEPIPFDQTDNYVSIAADAEGKYLVAATVFNEAKVFELATGKQIRKLPLPSDLLARESGFIRAVEITPDHTVVISLKDGRVLVYGKSKSVSQ